MAGHSQLHQLLLPAGGGHTGGQGGEGALLTRLRSTRGMGTTLSCTSSCKEGLEAGECGWVRGKAPLPSARDIAPCLVIVICGL